MTGVLSDEALAMLRALRANLDATEAEIRELPTSSNMTIEAVKIADSRARLLLSDSLTMADEVVAHVLRTIEPPRIWSAVLIQHLVSEKKFRQEWAPRIADVHHEYFELRSSGRPWAARLSLVVAHFAMLPTWFRNGIGLVVLAKYLSHFVLGY